MGQRPYLTAADIHARADWKQILLAFGIGEEFLLDRHGPCPLCGGRDRYRHDGKGRGRWICNRCGSGDGFSLLQRLYGWDFARARAEVLRVGGMALATTTPSKASEAPEVPASLTVRVRQILRNATSPDLVQDVVDYLASRLIWPLPSHCGLMASACVEYWADRKRMGNFSALLAPIVDIDGELITAHVTYLERGAKLEGVDPRKILSPMTGRTGCAVRLMPIKDGTLGVAEGIETALSAHRLHGVPVWAALNTALLAKFQPPEQVERLIVFADRDVPGLEAAATLVGRVRRTVQSVDLITPPAHCKDFSDALMEPRR